MYIDYLKSLIGYLEATQIYDGTGTAYENYEEGMGQLTALFSEVRKMGKQIFFIGNGGSAAIASHMTIDFMKNGGMKACSLSDSSVITCMGNDYGYEFIFSRPLEFLGNEGDLLVAISSSGNSQNMINAIEVAGKKNMRIMTLSGFQRQNRMRGMGDYNVHVPACHYGMVESIHNLILQQIVDSIIQRDRECL